MGEEEEAQGRGEDLEEEEEEGRGAMGRRSAPPPSFLFFSFSSLLPASPYPRQAVLSESSLQARFRPATPCKASSC